MSGSRPILIVAAGQTFEELSRTEDDFPDWIACGLGDGLPLRHVDARTAEACPDPRELAGVVVSGSHAMVTERAPWSEHLARWLRDCVDAQLPVLRRFAAVAHASQPRIGSRHLSPGFARSA